ncbi:TetR/AcrR family transcriptional regulator [Phytoactinopolyspora halotolerans]|uniref:TetR/AcrR family transcriptional regulator n=1 Tax=Phytoactinopolyspora halotolerans TaxID=1981512 RepID=A0A6L9SG51_9ACTN|nr:TetR/AcrR family transcriptional regulator [Phytoactinopolyspora halotolerans]NEE04256.1 TetR/AcrR family transcriptional regulator [Phytoactinopolyspora halotolerans]
MTEQIVKKTGRPRSEDADKAIIEATLELVAEVGVGGISIEGIAARAGVGKTTIYRRWPDKESVICDAVAILKGPVPDLPGTSLRDDLLVMADSTVRGRESTRDRRIYACFVGEMYRHPALKDRYHSTVIKPRRELIRRVLAAAVERGELRADLDMDVMIEVMTAPLLHWLLHHPEESPARKLIEQFVDGVLDGLRPR